MAAPVVDIAWANGTIERSPCPCAQGFLDSKSVLRVMVSQRLITTMNERQERRNQVFNSSNLIWRILFA